MIKRNPKVTENKESELVQMKQDYEACRELVTLKDHPGWIRIRAIIQANMGALKAQREDFQKINDEGLRFILKEEQDFEFFLGLVDKVEERMADLTSAISEVQSALNERKHNTTAPGSRPGI